MRRNYVKQLALDSAENVNVIKEKKEKQDLGTILN
jgi:hypothetical protein